MNQVSKRVAMLTLLAGLLLALGYGVVRAIDYQLCKNADVVTGIEYGCHKDYPGLYE